MTKNFKYWNSTIEDLSTNTNIVNFFLIFDFDLHLTFIDLHWPPVTSYDKKCQIIDFYNWRPFHQYPYCWLFFIFDFWPPFDLYWPLVTSCDLWWQKFSNNWILHLKTFPTIPKLLTFFIFDFDSPIAHSCIPGLEPSFYTLLLA